MQIVETMRQRELLEPWQLDMTEGDLYYNTRRYRKAEPFYERALETPYAQGNDTVRMALLKRLMNIHDLLFEDTKLMRNIFDMRQTAQKKPEYNAYLSMAEFKYGKRRHFQGYREEGYKRCLEAVEMLKEVDYMWKNVELRYDYAELLKMYMADGRYDEAIRMSELQEEMSRQRNATNLSILDERALRRTYGLRASLMAKAGRWKEADKAYTLWGQTKGGNAIDDFETLDYLFLTHRLDEANAIAKNYRLFLTEQGDTSSFRMLHLYNTDAQIHIAKGEYEMATEHLLAIKAITDSLQVATSRRQMTLSSNIIRVEQKMTKRTLIAYALAVIVLILVAGSVVNLYYVRVLRRRNRERLYIINELNAYRNRAIKANPESYAVDEVQTLETAAEKADTDENERLYVELDRLVTRDKLFLKPDLNRDDLARLIGVDKNRLGRIMVNYSNATNASVYVNMKRVEYGAQLLMQHPEYTISFIATECGMTNTVTFNRIFKEIYGCTPSEYRTNVERLQRPISKAS